MSVSRNDSRALSTDAIELAAADSAGIEDDYDLVDAELEDAPLAEDEEHTRDRADRHGLPTIPRGAPAQGDTIDVGAITREFATRATRRASPSTGGGVAPLTRISSSLSPDDDEDDEDEFAYDAPERRRLSQRRVPRKTLFTALFLLGVGVVFSALGLSFVWTLGMSAAMPFLVIGGIAFLPGSYVSFIMYQTWKGVPGYSYDQIPSYDD